MIRCRPIALGAITILAGLGGASAAHAAPKAKLSVTKLTGVTGAVDPGERFTARATVRNRGRKGGRGRLVASLREGTAAYSVPRRLGARGTGKVRRKSSARIRVRGRVPADVVQGTYRVQVCLTPANGRKRSCVRSGRITVGTPPGPEPTPSPSPTPAPTQSPTPEPTASPTATPTASPTPTPPSVPEQVADAVTADGMFAHLQALQDIADINDGNRAAGTAGYAASVQYVKGQLEDAGYDPVVQSFNFVAYTENAPPVLTQTAPGAPATIESGGLDYSPSGDVEAEVQTVDPNFTPPRASTDACEDEDFDGIDMEGKIALIQRGTCTFFDKAVNAAEAGAVGIVFFNQGDSEDPERQGLPAVTLGESPGIPAVGVSYTDGAALAQGGPKTVRLVTDTTLTPTTSTNILADTEGGDPERTVVIGSHLDSVDEGAGINDNGTGSAFNLELALQMAELGIEPKNRVRFAWWGAEEAGLVGSTEYVEGLTAEQAGRIAANLNFDMLGSPNYIRYVYDGDGSAFELPGPAGSDAIEAAFEDYFEGEGLATAPTAFDGRSDYGPFIAVGIPAGGLFSGAEEIKSQEQAAIFGGIPDVAFDPNYHQAGDTVNNVSRQGLTELGKGAAFVSGLYAAEAELSAPEITPQRMRKARRQQTRQQYSGTSAQR